MYKLIHSLLFSQQAYEQTSHFPVYFRLNMYLNNRFYSFVHTFFLN
jgi:hypothetical protein